MRKITNNELSDSLNNKIDNLQDATSLELMAESKTIVGAINELYGKDVIANAIGEPLNSTDTFSEMGSEINSLLSSFKTNMMNAGVAIESGDKFKQLIDKIKGLTEGDGNKGIQFASGTEHVSTEGTFHVLTGELPFEPYIIISIGTTKYPTASSTSTYGSIYIKPFNENVVFNYMYDPNFTSCRQYNVNDDSDGVTMIITENSFSFQATMGAYLLGDITWYAFGVGEEEPKPEEPEEPESFIPSWIEQNLSGQMITNNLIETLGSFDRYYKINNQIHFVQISASNPNWKVLNLKTGAVFDWSTYANNGLTTTVTCMDNDYLYAIEEKKVKRFDFNAKTWSSEFAINQNVKNNITYSSITFLDAICINEIIYTQYLINRDYVYFYASNLSDGTEYNTTPYAAGNVYGGYLLRYKDKIIWPAATNGAVSTNIMNLYDPIVGESSSLGYYVGETDNEDYGVTIHPTSCYIEGDYLYYISHTGNQYNTVYNVYIKDLTADYSDRYNMPYDQPLVENYTTKLSEAINRGVLIKINDKVLLSYKGFYII